jgi:hypothetical protein
VYLPPDARSTADLAKAFARMSDLSTARPIDTGFDQAKRFTATANRARSVPA